MFSTQVVCSRANAGLLSLARNMGRDGIECLGSRLRVSQGSSQLVALHYYYYDDEYYDYYYDYYYYYYYYNDDDDDYYSTACESVKSAPRSLAYA